MLHLGTVPVLAVLFDLDGTLVQTSIDFPLMRLEMQRMALDAGVPMDAVAEGEILEVVRRSAEAVGGERGTALRRAMWTRLEEIEREGAADPSIIAGSDELLARLRVGGARIGVVTRNCRAVSVPLLERFGLAADVLLTRDDVERTKPDPAHLHAALEVLDAPPSAAVMVGDHWMDVKAGQEAGCAATIGVLAPSRPPSWFDRCRPTFVVGDMSEAAALFHNKTH